jgi:plastocyanin
VPGTYAVSETVPEGWDLTSATCDDGSDPSAIGLAAGETVTCLFENTQRGKIIVEKQTDPDGSTQSFDFTSDYGAAFSLTDGQTNDSGWLVPGTYAVSETVPEGWDLTSATCDDGSDPSAIGLDAGETVTCLFENTQRGKIIVEKQTDPDGSTQLFDFVPDYGASFSLSDGQTNDSGWLVPGTYAVSETVPEGWDLMSATCDDGSDPSAIGLDAGETVTCVFENRQRGKIIVEKQTDPDGSTQSFDFTSDYGASFSLTDGQTNNSGWLVPGTYSVSETVPEGWDLTSATCDDGSDPSAIGLDAGETVTCLFENTQRGKIIVEKQTIPDGATVSFEFVPSWGANFFLLDGETITSGWLVPGSYSVYEIEPLEWALHGLVCTDPTGNTVIDLGSETAHIELDPGETVHCTFTNEQLYLAYTPGFWKNHGPDAPSDHNAWQYTNWSITDEFCVVFGAACVEYPEIFDGLTLWEALYLQGGAEEEGAAEILARHAVATFLNADLNEVLEGHIDGFGDYPYSTAEVVARVNEAFGEDRMWMLELAAEFDLVNNEASDYFDWTWPVY